MYPYLFWKLHYLDLSNNKLFFWQQYLYSCDDTENISLTSLVEDWESFSSRDDMGCTEHSSTCSTEIDDPLYLRR